MQTQNKEAAYEFFVSIYRNVHDLKFHGQLWKSNRVSLNSRIYI